MPRPPTVSKIVLPNRTAVGLGQKFEVRVDFDENVAVTGTPQIDLDVGGVTKTADFQEIVVDSGNPGNATSTLFAYTVAAGDEDTDGVSIDEDSLRLNGGTITDAGGTVDAVLDHEAVTGGPNVDTVKPTFVSASVDGDSLEVKWSEALQAFDLPLADDFTRRRRQHGAGRRRRLDIVRNGRHGDADAGLGGERGRHGDGAIRRSHRRRRPARRAGRGGQRRR